MFKFEISPFASPQKVSALRNLPLNLSVPPSQDEHFFQLALHVARVVQLNEFELYFEGSQFQGVISPRNEIQALNLLYKKAVEASENGGNGLWLRKKAEETMDAMSFPEYQSEKGTSSSLPYLFDWIKQNDIRHNIEVSDFPTTGRGASALFDLGFAETIIEVPVDLIITESTFNESEMGPILDSIEGIDKEAKTILWLIHEKFGDSSNSKFSAFFSSLPNDLLTGQTLGTRALRTLLGTTLFEEIIADREVVNESYDALFPLLSETWPDTFPETVFSRKNFVWAVQLWGSYGMKLKFPDSEIKTGIAPVACFLNHSVFPHITEFSTVDPISHKLKLKLLRSCKKSNQIFLSYGPLSNAQLLKDYGFVLEDNPYDFLPLDFSEVAEQDENLWNLKKEILEKWEISLESHMIRNCKNKSGFPKPLMAVLRVLVLDNISCQNFEGNPFEKINDENEKLALITLRDCVENLLESLPENEDSSDVSGEDFDIILVQKYIKEYSNLLNSAKLLCQKLLGEF